VRFEPKTNGMLEMKHNHYTSLWAVAYTDCMTQKLTFSFELRQTGGTITPADLLSLENKISGEIDTTFL